MTRSRDEWLEVARGNVERNLADSVDTPDSIFDNVYILAFDAMHDEGCSDELARELAQWLAMGYANP